MDLDKDKIDDAALALLYLTLHDGCRAWKGVSWDVLDRLHEKELIYDPVAQSEVGGFHAGGIGTRESAVCGDVREVTRTVS